MTHNSDSIKKRTLTGTVVSDAMQKTRVVAVERMTQQKLYHARYKATARYKAHDEQNTYHVGDVVIIQETRPLSRDKRWEIVKLVKKGEGKIIQNEDENESVETE